MTVKAATSRTEIKQTSV